MSIKAKERSLKSLLVKALYCLHVWYPIIIFVLLCKHFWKIWENKVEVGLERVSRVTVNTTAVFALAASRSLQCLMVYLGAYQARGLREHTEGSRLPSYIFTEQKFHL